MLDEMGLRRLNKNRGRKVVKGLSGTAAPSLKPYEETSDANIVPKVAEKAETKSAEVDIVVDDIPSVTESKLATPLFVPDPVVPSSSAGDIAESSDVFSEEGEDDDFELCEECFNEPCVCDGDGDDSAVNSSFEIANSGTSSPISKSKENGENALSASSLLVLAHGTLFCSTQCAQCSN